VNNYFKNFKIKLDKFVVFSIFAEILIVVTTLSKVAHNIKNFDLNAVSLMFYFYLAVILFLIAILNLRRFKIQYVDLIFNFFRLLVFNIFICTQFSGHPISDITLHDGYSYFFGMSLLKIFMLIAKHFENKSSDRVFLLIAIYIGYVYLISYYINTKADLFSAAILIALTSIIFIFKNTKSNFAYKFLYLLPLAACFHQLVYFYKFI
jgi:hypothetical protein